ncbi:MAG: alpha/beta hydrolase [Clostridia bacterium]|nr:alpha/beta hydrolase [Clostridia bacterium]
MKTNGLYRTMAGEKALMDFYDRMLESWPLAYEELYAGPQNERTHVIAAGTPGSPPLVLLHGSTSNAATWAGDIASYAREFRVYAPDMPGEPGKSFTRRLSWDNDDYSLWLLRLFEELNLDKPCMAGLSLGGWAALRFASDNPDRVSRIALIAPGGIVNPRMKAVFKMMRYASQGEAGAEKTMRLLFPDDFESPEVMEFFSLLNAHFIYRRDALKPLTDKVLSSIKAPVFMISGAEDAFFDFRKAEKRLLRLIPHAQTLLFDKGRHGLVAMADTIIPFLKS